MRFRFVCDFGSGCNCCDVTRITDVRVSGGNCAWRCNSSIVGCSLTLITDVAVDATGGSG